MKQLESPCNGEKIRSVFGGLIENSQQRAAVGLKSRNDAIRERVEQGENRVEWDMERVSTKGMIYAQWA